MNEGEKKYPDDTFVTIKNRVNQIKWNSFRFRLEFLTNLIHFSAK